MKRGPMFDTGERFHGKGQRGKGRGRRVQEPTEEAPMSAKPMTSEASVENRYPDSWCAPIQSPCLTIAGLRHEIEGLKAALATAEGEVERLTEIERLYGLTLGYLEKAEAERDELRAFRSMVESDPVAFKEALRAALAAKDPK